MHSNFRVWLFIVALTTASVTLNFTEHQLTAFTVQLNGEDGADGLIGDPGTDGQNGTDGSDVTEDIENDFGVARFGGRGGSGGNGGDGVDGDDEGTSAQGGNAGHAGNGGNVRLTRMPSVQQYDSTTAVGGNGGVGGRGGFGTSNALTGLGGNGGHGGHGSIAGDLSFWQRFSAVGGRGGNGTGNGAFGGNGGRAFLSTRLTNTLQSATLFVTGGIGGSGSDGFNGGIGATGGNGGAATFGFNAQNMVFSEDFDADLDRSLRINLYGGRGGDTTNGVVGRGGTARLSLESIANAGYNNFGITSSILAGSGGRGFSTGNQDTDGIGGSIAMLKTGDNLNLRFANIFLRGGNGGSALGRQNQGDGGNGASAIVDGPLNISDRDSYLRLNMAGGIGGHAQGSGWSGNGGSVIAPEISLSDEGFSSFMNVDLRAGDGGWGRRNGSGGDAIMRYEGNRPEPGTDQALSIGNYRATSYGGNAGQGLNSVNAATGGDGVAEISQTRSSVLDISTIAQGGIGNQGASGDASAIAYGHSTFDERLPVFSTPVTTNAIATSRNGTGGRWRPSYGTNSNAEATSINENTGGAFSSAFANGSWGFIEGGDARSSATSVASQEGYAAVARATSRGAGSTNITDGNIAESFADATATTGSSANARAQSSRVGHNVTAHSSSTATGDRINSYSLASTSTSSWNHSASVMTETGNGFEMDGQVVSAENISLVQFRSTEAFAQPVFDGEMTAALLVNPVEDQIADFVSNESNYGDVFLGDDSQVIGIGSILASGTEGGSLDSEANISLSLEVQEFQTGERLQLGFFGLGEMAEGFEFLAVTATLNGRSLVNEGWIGEDSATEATAFFDDLLFDVMDTPTNLETIDLNINFSTTTTNADALFGIGFVFGNVGLDSETGDGFAFQAFRPPVNLSAVPEPGSMAILLSIGMLAAIRRRR